MSIVIRAPEYDEWPDVCRADGRVFGSAYTTEEIEEKRAVHDVTRFRIALDGRDIVGVAGSYAMEVTLPGGGSVPMGGVTWVSTAPTHRRQGVMRTLMNAVHDDIDERGETVASLFSAQGGIYEHIGYGIATRIRVTTVDRRLTRMRDEFRARPAATRLVEGDEVVAVVSEIWDRFCTQRAGEAKRSAGVQRFLFEQRSKNDGPLGPATYLCHADGYALYRLEEHWNDGHPAHTLHLTELAAATSQAHSALWQVLLEMDLVAEIRSTRIPIDDPLPFLLDDPRAVRTRDLNDGVWVNVRDIPTAFAARTYRSDARIVVDVDGRRWAVDGGAAGGASCARVRARADLVTSHAGFSALLYGGVLPSSLVAGRRMEARSPAVLECADVFFTTSLAPHCQDTY